MKRLPKTFRGAEVVRGLGLTPKQIDTLVDKKALSEFSDVPELWVVVEDRALAPHHSVDVKAFAKKEDAVRYARACANGNVDHRVLRVTDQVLVVATENEL